MAASTRRRIWIAIGLVALVVALFAMWRGREEPTAAASDDAREAARTGKRRGIGGERDDDGAREKLRWNREGASISGTVRSTTGEPIANADVCAWISARSLPTAIAREPVCTKTGKDGRYTLADMRPVYVGVHASAPTYIPGQYEVAPGKEGFELQPGRARTGVDIVLAKGGVEIHGVVKDIAGGVVEGALVNNEAWSWNGGRTRGRGLTKSDAKGEFTLWVAPGSVAVTANAEGYAPESASGPVPGYTFEIFLTPESVLAGVVVAAKDGKPIAGVRVDSAQDWMSGGGGDGQAITDEDGRFRIERLGPGRYKPTATSEDGYGAAKESVHLGVGQSVDDVRIELHPAATIRGKIVIAGAQQRPCERGNASIRDPLGGRNEWAMVHEDGTVEFTGVLPGTYDVGISCDKMVTAESYPSIVVGTDPVPEQVWEVHEGLAVVGIVVGPDGVGLADASVSANPKTAAPRGQVSNAWAERTDKDGRFRLDGLIAGTYAVSADIDGLDVAEPVEPTEVVVENGKIPDVRIQLDAAGTVEGRVLDTAGKPVAKAQISLRGDEHGRGRATSTDDGTFTIRGLRPDGYRATASRGWSETMRAPGTSDDDVQGERVTVRAGETAKVELVVADRSGKLSGRVVDESGGPVDDAFVHADRESDSARTAQGSNRRRARWGSWDKQPLLTDQDGAFEIGELEPGKYTVFATRKGGGEGLAEHVEVGSKNVVVHIAPGGSIAGTVMLAGGGVPARFTVHVEDRVQGMNRSEEFYETGGQWTMADLLPGKYDVAVEAREGRDTENVVLADGEDKTGVVFELEPKVDVEGTVVDLDSGEPVANLEVSISPRRGGGFTFFGDDAAKENVTDATGKFVVKAAPAGKVTIMLMPRTWGDDTYGWTNTAATIPNDSDRYTLPPLRIVKSRLKRGKQAGDLGFTVKESDAEKDVEDAPIAVAFIRPGGPAATTELAIGDVIVEVDGKDVRGENRSRYFTLTRVPQGTKVEIGTDGGKTVTIVAGKPP